MMKKADEIIRNHILNTRAFKTASGIAYCTIIGFNGAHYHYENRAVNKVNSVIKTMLLKKEIKIDFIDGINIVHVNK